MTNGFVTVARTCGNHDESLEGAISWLQNTSHSWLLIIDNADNEDLDLARFLPAGRNGSILITTRLIECAKHQTVGNADCYERLNQETAIELLLKACGIKASLRSAHEDDARAVVELLGCHALAVIQAGAAISQDLCNLGEYKDIFLHQRQTLFKCFPRQAQSEYGGVYATFEVSATYLKARGDQIAKDALQLLSFYAFMHFTDFPEAAFEEAWKNSRDEAVVYPCSSPDEEEPKDEDTDGDELDTEESDGDEDIRDLSPWHVSHLPTFMRRNPRNIDLNKICVRQARSLLASLSLVTFDSASGTTRMHPVSHFWSRDRLHKPEEFTNAGLNGLCVLSLSIENPYARETGPLVSQLQPHIESIAFSLREWDLNKGSFRLQQSIYQLSWVMYRLNCDSALFELLRNIPIQENESWLRTEKGQLIQTLHGISMCEFGDAKKAVTLLERLCETREQILGAQDQSVLTSQHELAKAYLKIDDTTRALETLERIVHIQNKKLIPEHPERLASQHELARAYLRIEKTAKAIALLEAVVEIQTRTLRPEHSDLLTSQHELARAYLNIEETAKAIALLELVVEIRTRTLRLENSNLLTSQHELARAYLNIGETAKAIALLELVVEIQIRTLRPEHRELLTSQHELARAYLRIEETAKAIALLEPVVEIRTRTLRPEHSDLLTSQHTLAQTYLDIGETAKAIALLESVVEIRTRTLRPEHHDLLASQHELARVYLRIEETAKAIALLKSVVKIRTRTLRPEHSSLLTSQHVLASAYLRIEETTKAIILLETVVEIQTRTLRPEHSSLLTSQHELASAYLDIRETAKAMALVETVVEIRVKTQRADDPARVASIYLLAQCYYRAKNYDRALKLAKSIENVAQNRPGNKVADYNTHLIGLILEEMDLEEDS